jgi:thymidylate kinase
MSGITKPLVVEFAGIPGSGKTSLSRVTAVGLRSNGVRAFTVLDAARIRAAETMPGSLLESAGHNRMTGLLLWWLFYLASSVNSLPFLWSSRKGSIALARAQALRHIRPGMKAHIGWWYVQLGGRRRYLDSSESMDAVLYDDGFVHRSVILFSSPGEPEAVSGLDRYLDTMRMPDVVVHVRSDVDTGLQRVMDRGVWNHSRRATIAELERYLERASQILEEAVEGARRRGATVIGIDNVDSTLDESSQSLISRLASLVEPADRGQRT